MLKLLIDKRTYLVIFSLLLIFFCLNKAREYGYNQNIAENVKANAAKDATQKSEVDKLKKQISDYSNSYIQSLIDASNQQIAWRNKLQRVEQDANLKQQAAQVAATTAIAMSTSLRQSLSLANAKLSSLANTNPTNSAATDYAIAVNAVFDDCSGQYQSMAAKADGHAIDAAKLEQAWPSK